MYYENVKINIQYDDEEGHHIKLTFREDSLEEAETIIGLMTGNICLEDLQP